MSASFERFCLASGLETLSEMVEQDATAACGERHERGSQRQAHRWGRTKGKIGFHGGKVEIERPRVRGLDGAECVLPSWESAVSEDLLGKWAMNQMLINVSTRRFKRSVRLPEGDVPALDGAGLSKSATSRRFVALSAARMKAWMETRLDDIDLLAIQIDGIHMDEDMLLVAAIGIDANGDKHPLGLVEGATENATTVQALIDNLVERGLDRIPSPELSITHSLNPCDFGSEFDVGQADEATPDDHVTRRRVRSSCEVSAKSGELRQIGDQRAGLGLTVADVADEPIEKHDFCVRQRHGGRRARRSSGEHRQPQHAPADDAEDRDQVGRAIGGAQFCILSPAAGFQDLMEDLDLPAHRVAFDFLDRLGAAGDWKVGEQLPFDALAALGGARLDSVDDRQCKIACNNAPLRGRFRSQ